MTSRLLALAVDAREPLRLARFWADLLDRPVVEDGDGVLLPGEGAQLDLRFRASGSAKTRQNPVHLHLTSDASDQQRVVAAALALGAVPVDVGQRPEDTHVVLADPEGDEFCVIEPGNRFLAGCGLLGEVTCEGTRDVGLFWSRALGWPLVWDVDGETAVQSPDGGTKVSWGGEPAPPGAVRERLRLDVGATGGDVEAEADRLVGLGAVRLPGPDGPGRVGTVALADPDGHEFRLVPV